MSWCWWLLIYLVPMVAGQIVLWRAGKSEPTAHGHSILGCFHIVMLFWPIALIIAVIALIWSLSESLYQLVARRLP